MAEMITGYPLFRGRDNADQLVQIMKIVGTPSNETLAQIKHDSVCLLASYLEKLTDKKPEIQIKTALARHPKQPLHAIIPKAPRDGKLNRPGSQHELIFQPSTCSKVYCNSSPTVVMTLIKLSPTHTLPLARSHHLLSPTLSLPPPHRSPSRHE